MGTASQPSRGRIERRIWTSTLDYGVPRRHRGSRPIDCYVPDPVAAWDLSLPSALAGLLADADAALRELNSDVPRLRALEALSRQLLRQESVGSSRIEGLELGQRRLARAAAGVGVDETARQIVGNIRAMERAIALASQPRAFTLDDLLAIHRTLFAETRDTDLGGNVRREQNWIGGSGHSPAGAEFVPPPPELVGGLLDQPAAGGQPARLRRRLGAVPLRRRP